MPRALSRRAVWCSEGSRHWAKGLQANQHTGRLSGCVWRTVWSQDVAHTGAEIPLVYEAPGEFLHRNARMYRSHLPAIIDVRLLRKILFGPNILQQSHTRSFDYMAATPTSCNSKPVDI